MTRSETASSNKESFVDEDTKKSYPLFRIKIFISSLDEEDKDTSKEKKGKKGKAAPQTEAALPWGGGGRVFKHPQNAPFYTGKLPF